MKNALGTHSREIVASAVAKFALSWSHPTMTIESMMERFWGLWVRDHVLEDMNEVYRRLVDLNFQEGMSEHDFFYIPADVRVIAHTGNFNFLFLWDKSKFHIRRFWSPWTALQEEESEDPADYSDNFAATVDVCRPDLDWYKKRKFLVEGEYADCRDTGYVATYSDLHARVERAISHHTLLKISLGCCVPAMIKAMLKREATGPWKKISDLGG
jgi:hypothetical protein